MARKASADNSDDESAASEGMFEVFRLANTKCFWRGEQASGQSMAGHRDRGLCSDDDHGVLAVG